MKNHQKGEKTQMKNEELLESLNKEAKGTAEKFFWFTSKKFVRGFQKSVIMFSTKKIKVARFHEDHQKTNIKVTDLSSLLHTVDPKLSEKGFLTDYSFNHSSGELYIIIAARPMPKTKHYIVRLRISRETGEVAGKRIIHKLGVAKNNKVCPLIEELSFIHKETDVNNRLPLLSKIPFNEGKFGVFKYNPFTNTLRKWFFTLIDFHKEIGNISPNRFYEERRSFYLKSIQIRKKSDVNILPIYHWSALTVPVVNYKNKKLLRFNKIKVDLSVKKNPDWAKRAFDEKDQNLKNKWTRIILINRYAFYSRGYLFLEAFMVVPKQAFLMLKIDFHSLFSPDLAAKTELLRTPIKIIFSKISEGGEWVSRKGFDHEYDPADDCFEERRAAIGNLAEFYSVDCEEFEEVQSQGEQVVTITNS